MASPPTPSVSSLASSTKSDPSCPFENPHADILLLSSDGAEYRMSKAALILASPFFENMLSLPQPADAPPGDEHHDGLPVVHLTDSSDVLGTLLHFCLPRAPPELHDLGAVVRVLEGAKKYQMEWAHTPACDALRRLAEREPIRAYAVACRYGLKREAEHAALFALRMTVSAIVGEAAQELQSISGEDYRRLLKYRIACQEAVVNHLASGDWEYRLKDIQVEGDLVWMHDCIQYRQGSRAPSMYRSTSRSGEGREHWWRTYRNRMVDTLKECTWEGAVKPESALSEFIRSNPCAQCCLAGPEQMLAVSEDLAQEVVTQISSVSLVAL